MSGKSARGSGNTNTAHQSQHARRLFNGSAAAEEAHDHHEGPRCDQDVHTCRTQRGGGIFLDTDRRRMEATLSNTLWNTFVNGPYPVRAHATSEPSTVSECGH